MTEMREEDVLRERFRGLRDEAVRQGRVPAFDAMIARARAEAALAPSLEVHDGGVGTSRPASRRLVRTGAWAAALAAAVAAVLLVERGPDGDAEFERLVAAWSAETSTPAWRSPTSGLLDVPGMELTRSVPSLGVPVRGLDLSTRPAPAAPPREEPS